MPRGVYVRTEATRKAMSERMRGRIMSPERRRKISLAMQGRVLSPETRQKISEAQSQRGREGTRGEKAWNWKEEDVGYSALHRWVRKNFAKTGICQEYDRNVGSKTQAGTHWACIGHEYTRKREAWRELCPRCHRAFDALEKGSNRA